ncbi:MAG TPA: potassium transporter TrkG [Ignavibacteriaceae bacterium]|nr:potassium transporter TrkG [Ignavibacteriaceae bacterium]
MNTKIIAYIIGFLLIIEGLLMLPGVVFSLYYGDEDVLAIVFSSSITVITGLVLWFFSKSKEHQEIKKRDGYIIVALGWFLMSVFGTLPFLIHGSVPSFIDAFFETVSGFTTTGASVIRDVEILPHGILFWRSMTHWIGGMGIIVLSLAILPLLGIGGMQLYVAEVAGPTKDKLHPRVQETAKRLWGIYVLITIAQTFLLLFGGMNLFDSLCHSFGTVATGGFSTKNASVAFYNSAYIDYVIIFFMFISGTNFTLHYLALHGKIKSYFEDEEFRFYLIFVLTVVFSIGIYLTITSSRGFEEAVRHAAFSVISILSSTGFVTDDYEKWGYFFSTIFLVLLLMGACAGSTSGGIKMVRHYLLLKNSVYELKRLIHPNAILPVRYNKKAVAPDIISKVSAFTLLYFFIFALASIIMAMTGLELSSAMGAVAACLGNIGPGLGSTGPATTFANVSDFGKAFLSFIMLLGRLELFTILIIFSPSFWKK